MSTKMIKKANPIINTIHVPGQYLTNETSIDIAEMKDMDDSKFQIAFTIKDYYNFSHTVDDPDLVKWELVIY